MTADVPPQDPAWVPIGSTPDEGAPPGSGVEVEAPAPAGGEPGRSPSARAAGRPLALHPMGVPDILDGAFTLFKANARPLVLVTALFMVPIELVTAFLSRDVFGGMGLLEAARETSIVGFTVTSGPGSTVASLLAFAFTVLVRPALTAALVHLAASAYLGVADRPGDAVRRATRRWPAFVAAFVLVHLIEGFGFAFLLLPGLLAVALCTAVVPVMAVEGLGPGEALGRSFRLSGPRLFPTVLVVVATAAISSALATALGGIPNLAALLIGYSRAWVLAATGTVLAALVVQPYVACVALLVYVDGRIRQEGLDIAVRMEELASVEDPR